MSLSDTTYAPPYQGVANEVRAWLGRRRITASAAAKKLGWKQPYLSRRLTGLVPFDAADLISLGELLEVEPAAFFHTPEQAIDRRARNIMFWRRRQPAAA